MPIESLQNFSARIARTKGYLSFNQRTNTVEVQGRNFLSRLVTWIRYRRSASAHNAAMKARDEIVATLVSDNHYGKFFKDKFAGKYPKEFLVDKKPLSARKISRFIKTVTTEVQGQVAQQQSAAERKRVAIAQFGWCLGKENTENSREWMPKNINSMLAEKMKNVRGVSVGDVAVSGLRDEVNQLAMQDDTVFEAMNTPAEVERFARQTLSDALDKRIGDAIERHRLDLHQTLSSSGLLAQYQRGVKSIIDANPKNLTHAELDAAISRAITEQNHAAATKIDSEFYDLYKGVQQKNDFSAQLKGLDLVKQHLYQVLEQEGQSTNKPLTVDSVRARASELLNQFIAGKKAALNLAQSSPMTGVQSLVNKLVLKNPFLGEHQAKMIEKEVGEAFQESYEQNKVYYEQAGVTTGTFISKLNQLYRGNDLPALLAKATQPQDADLNVFDSQWTVTGVKAQVNQYIEETAERFVEALKEAEGLKGSVPDVVYQRTREGAALGVEVGPEFYEASNVQYIDHLTSNNNEALYKLFFTPQVLDRRIGSVKEDTAHKKQFESFTLRDLLDASVDPKSKGKQPKKLDETTVSTKEARERIDRLIPDDKMEDLLAWLETQLEKVRSGTLNEKSAEALFQREIINFLRAQDIDFTTQVTGATVSDTPVWRETPI